MVPKNPHAVGVHDRSLRDMMEEKQFEKLARAELAYIEERFDDVDPDEVEVSSTDGVITLELKDGVKVIINSHRAARQIWMAAVVNAWHFDFDSSDNRWRTGKKEELRAVITGVVRDRIGLEVDI
jgi:CyaY protein